MGKIENIKLVCTLFIPLERQIKKSNGYEEVFRKLYTCCLIVL